MAQSARFSCRIHRAYSSLSNTMYRCGALPHQPPEPEYHPPDGIHPHGYFRVRYWSPQDHLSPNGVGSPDPPRFLCQNHIFFNGLECGSFGLKMTRNGLLAINFPPHFAGIFIPVSNAWPMWCPSLTINRHLPNQPFPQRFSFWQIVKRADRSPQDHLSPDGVGSPDPPRFLFCAFVAKSRFVQEQAVPEPGYKGQMKPALFMMWLFPTGQVEMRNQGFGNRC